MTTETMLDFVLRSLDSNKGRHKEISEITGVEYTTLSKISQRVTKNPTIGTVQALADYFKKAA